MAQAERRERSSDAERRELEDMIEHWVEVIDRWVRRIDSGFDGEGPADRRSASDSGTEAEPAS